MECQIQVSLKVSGKIKHKIMVQDYNKGELRVPNIDMAKLLKLA